MSCFLQIHPTNPQPRLIGQVVEQLRGGAVLVYPTDSSYALGCQLGDKAAAERIRHIRQTDRHHNFTLVCRDLSEIATYAKVDNQRYRLLKAATPGPFTFILQATHEVPRRLQHPRRKTIGIRVPDNAIVRALLAELGEPIMSCTLTLPGDEWPLHDPEEIEDRLRNQVDLIIDGGPGQREPTTVIDLTDAAPHLIRQGLGDASPFL
ncbi:MAG: threonylcarbamoyl-AMP synthase [Candidatus Competibacteraceae bacterium]|uniref:Protein yciO n=1 Tax=Candidatus Contendobacter odensis Run_B_J11 TaxID=1400861 RepID=A0A7U7GCB2_9GAMM|nr:L-threonylcarbamoyladenylate synthase [Candidatus Contendobacter odensis]MBK8534218.1 threonylcarbamoyl-AMP synthase [Candidatus Competibacteraceae bacterium]MBK8752008.1 threonylcarbamoyl-AMP synthase [Candidatus Competibacteraceae bacterium]CDH45796.1 Protein yciO [Candidatus Contendobacter odensis Run_B_J11]